MLLWIEHCYAKESMCVWHDSRANIHTSHFVEEPFYNSGLTGVHSALQETSGHVWRHFGSSKLRGGGGTPSTCWGTFYGAQSTGQPRGEASGPSTAVSAVPAQHSIAHLGGTCHSVTQSQGGHWEGTGSSWHPVLTHIPSNPQLITPFADPLSFLITRLSANTLQTAGKVSQGAAVKSREFHSNIIVACELKKKI